MSTLIKILPVILFFAVATVGTGAFSAESGYELTLVKQIDGMQKEAVPPYINAWIASSLSLDSPVEEGTPENILKEMKGICGHREILFSSLLDKYEIKSRRINFFNVPIMLGHTAIEVNINGAWQFYDPTFGIFFSKKDSDIPISIREARNIYPDILVWRVDSKLNSGIWNQSKSFKYKKYKKNRIYGSHGLELLADIERTYFSSSMSGAPEIRTIFNNYNFNLDEIKNWDSAEYYEEKSETDSLYRPAPNLMGMVNDTRTGERLTFLSNSNATVKLSVSYEDRSDAYINADLDHAGLHYSHSETSLNKKEGRKKTSYVFSVYPPYSSLKFWHSGNELIRIKNISWEMLE